MLTGKELYNFMDLSRLNVISTIGIDRAPQSALVGFAATYELEIIFDTVKTSRKYRNLVANPACSFVIGWSGEQTLQYQGNAEELYAPELQRYQATYFRVWPECRAHLNWPAIVHFVVRPTWIRYSDFEQNPPSIQEFGFALNKPAQTDFKIDS